MISARFIRQIFQAAPRLIQQPGPVGWWLRFKFIARGVVYARWLGPWLDYLELPAMKTVVQVRPRLYLKVQWPYINNGYGAAQRLEVLLHHYNFVFERLSREMRAHLLFTDFIPIATWEVHRLGRFSLRLSHGNSYVQEGEMIIDLHHEATNRPCALAHFSITRDERGRHVILIGCFQGGKPADDPGEISTREVVIGFKKHLYGLRPKNMILFALRHVAAGWGIERMRGVSNERQIWTHQVQFDYNTFWTDSGGTPAPDGMFDLPIEAGFDDLRDRSKKRSMYRRRHLFLELLGQAIARRLADPDQPPEQMDLAELEAAGVVEKAPAE